MNAEVRGRGKNWRVYYTDPSNMGSPVLVFGEDGVHKDTLLVGAPGDRKLVEAYGGPFPTAESAEAYALYLGATHVKVVKTKTPAEALKVARASR